LLNEKLDRRGIDIKSSRFKNILKIFEFEQSNVQNKNNFAELKLGFLLTLMIVDCTNIKMIITN
jgi:hypothetical protein